MRTLERLGNRMIGKRGESGMSLLEYAMGAAVLVGIVYAAVSAFGGSLQSYFQGLSGFVNNLPT